MRERKLYVCDACGKETPIIRLIAIKMLFLELCPKCHKKVSTYYSELEIIA